MNFLTLLLLLPALLDSIVAGWHAPNELRDDQVLLVQEAATLPQSGTYNQAIQLERGWNLVSWYLIPPDPTVFSPLIMDDLFNTALLPWGPQDWFDSDREEPVLDWVGKHDADPRRPDPQTPPQLYPWHGYYDPPNVGWEWKLPYAYYIHLDSPAHFWEFADRPHYTPSSFTFNTSSVWDDSIGGGSTRPPNHWFFLGYPLRMSQLIDEDRNGVSENSTIHDLETQANPLRVLKSADGKVYIPGNPHGSTLKYLEPGRGYFMGFLYAQTNKGCQGFVTDVEPYSLPSAGAKTGETENPETASLTPAHFTFQSRTSWWYPIEIDTVDLNGVTLAAGDEIAVFDGDLCVGAEVYCDSFPLVIAAWEDDLATPDTVDGYQDDHEMTFKWFDASENQEIVFVPPPETQAVGDDRLAPTHSGFGYGFYARRNLNYGIAAGFPRNALLSQSVQCRNRHCPGTAAEVEC